MMFYSSPGKLEKPWSAVRSKRKFRCLGQRHLFGRKGFFRTELSTGCPDSTSLIFGIIPRWGYAKTLPHHRSPFLCNCYRDRTLIWDSNTWVLCIAHGVRNPRRPSMCQNWTSILLEAVENGMNPQHRGTRRLWLSPCFNLSSFCADSTKRNATKIRGSVSLQVLWSLAITSCRSFTQMIYGFHLHKHVKFQEQANILFLLMCTWHTCRQRLGNPNSLWGRSFTWCMKQQLCWKFKVKRVALPTIRWQSHVPLTRIS